MLDSTSRSKGLELHKCDEEPSIRWEDGAFIIISKGHPGQVPKGSCPCASDTFETWFQVDGMAACCLRIAPTVSWSLPRYSRFDWGPLWLWVKHHEHGLLCDLSGIWSCQCCHQTAAARPSEMVDPLSACWRAVSMPLALFSETARLHL
jgi:hypothetical protein